jgi:hypothetical protein
MVVSPLLLEDDDDDDDFFLDWSRLELEGMKNPSSSL